MLRSCQVVENRLDLGRCFHDLSGDDDCSIFAGLALVAEHIFRGGTPASMVTRA
jgi:hypothetical protein